MISFTLSGVEGFAVFIFGLAIGSFLNALIHRLEKGESALHGRSYCPRCKHPLAWQDLIPLLSFVVLRGRCRYCKEKISFQYPFVELATGIVFFAVFNLAELSLEVNLARLSLLAYLWAMTSSLIVIFVYDLKHYMIPDKILFLAIGITVFWRIFEFLNFDILNLFRISDLEFGISALPVQSLVAGISVAIFFLAIFLVSRGAAMGFGDVKLAFLLGLFLGWPSILVAMFLAFLIGAVSGLVLIALKKKHLKSEVPFAPFLITGTTIAFFFGSSILNWYLGLFLV